jgi:transglutaminase-like putative cysteine protease
MILEIQHETRFEYSQPVIESIAEVRMEPVSDADQSCRSFHLAVSPATDVFRYQDGFGNRVHHFNVLPANTQMCILAASVVETHPRHRDFLASAVTYPLGSGGLDVHNLDFLRLTGPVHPTPRLEPVLDALRPEPGAPLGQFVSQAAQYIREHFEYAKDVTLASSPIDHLLEQGKGVCQDFTHLMIAVLRSCGVPARYVSGYIHRPGKESQSHAWCEAWLPDQGWIGIDPTNNRIVDDHFVKVAICRDFNDVPPNKGVYRGTAEESILVRVETRALDRLPSLSWQEQLPPLETPLTAIAPRLRWGPAGDEDSQHQQQ